MPSVTSVGTGVRAREAAVLSISVPVWVALLAWPNPVACRQWAGRPEATPAELRAGDFAAGSMGPKVLACCRFVEATGKVAAIGALEQALAIARGEAGTRVRSGPRLG